MTLDELLSRLQTNDIRIWSKDGYLHCSAPKGVLDSQLRAGLEAHKSALLGSLASGASLEQPLETDITCGDPSSTIGWFTNLAEMLGDSGEAGPTRRKQLKTQLAIGQTAVPRESAVAALSFEQEEYFLDYLRGRTLRKVAVAARINGRVLVEVVRQTLTELVGRHEALRTTVGVVNGQVCQAVHDPEVELHWRDLSDHLNAEEELECERRMGAAVDLDIVHGPILWAKLVRTNIDQHVLLVTVSHFAMDGWSLELLIEEFAILYAAFSEGRPSPLSRTGVRYVDYSRWSRKRSLGNGLQNLASYWRGRLLNDMSRRILLPADRPRGKTLPTTSSVRLQLDAQLISSLEKLSVRERTTLFCVLLAALAVVISRCTKAEDISVATVFANRSAEFESLVGLCTTPVILRLKLSDNPVSSTLLARAHDAVLGAQAHQGLPPHRILADLGCPDVIRTVLCPAVFLLLTYPHRGNPKLNMQVDALPPIPGLNVEAADVLAENEDLAIIIDEEADGTRGGAIHYRSDLFDAERIQRFGNDFIHVLRFFAMQPPVPIADIPNV
jgi:hypothetical protein